MWSLVTFEGWSFVRDYFTVQWANAHVFCPYKTCGRWSFMRDHFTVQWANAQCFCPYKTCGRWWDDVIGDLLYYFYSTFTSNYFRDDLCELFNRFQLFFSVKLSNVAVHSQNRSIIDHLKVGYRWFQLFYFPTRIVPVICILDYLLLCLDALGLSDGRRLEGCWYGWRTDWNENFSEWILGLQRIIWLHEKQNWLLWTIFICKYCSGPYLSVRPKKNDCRFPLAQPGQIFTAGSFYFITDK